MAQRPAWEGHLKLSLVTCPVALYAATGKGKSVRFNMLNPETGNRIRTKVHDPATGADVARSDTLKGFAIDKDLFVTVTDDEIRAAKLPDTGGLSIERFVPVKDIDRLYWASPYYLVPQGDVAIEPYTVIREAMRAEGKVALARYVKGGKERQLALEPRGAGIIAHELRTHDQVHAETEHFGRIPDVKVDKNMVAIARQILAQHEGPFDPMTFRDRYTEGLLALIEAKKAARGARRSTGAASADEGQILDLMEQLKRSLAGAGAATPEAGARRKRADSKVQPTAANDRAPAARRRRAG